MTGAEIAVLIGAAAEILKMVEKLREEAQRRREWTAADEKSFDARMRAAFAEAHWQPKSGARKAGREE